MTVRSLFLDASALVKRFVPETGTPVMNHLFATVTPERLMMLALGTAEIVSVLVRKRNDGRIDQAVFSQAMLSFGTEVVSSSELKKLDMDSALIAASIPLIDAHALNSTDAIVLRSALDVGAVLRTGGDDLVLVASDQRLLRAATAEGLTTLNPETATTVDVDNLAAS
jgi:predicted nucleic acid-binding protein